MTIWMGPTQENFTKSQKSIGDMNDDANRYYDKKDPTP